jgi:hypothetical protein
VVGVANGRDFVADRLSSSMILSARSTLVRNLRTCRKRPHNRRSSRFARELVTQEVGIIALIRWGVRVVTATGDDWRTAPIHPAR